MADQSQPIGISFIPSAQNQANGPQALAADGGMGRGSTDLAQAYKILSLRLPQVVGAQAPTPQSNLTSAGSSALATLPGGLNPYAAAFQALLKSMMGGGFDPMAMRGIGTSAASATGDPNSMGAGSELPGAMTPTPRNPPALRLGSDGQPAPPSTGAPDAGASTGGYGVDARQPEYY